MRGNNFTYLVKQGVVSIWYNRMMSFACFCIMMVSLLVVGLAVLVGLDIGEVLSHIENRNEVLVYVDGGVETEKRLHISDVLRANPYVNEVVFYSKEEAWEEQKEALREFGEEFLLLWESVEDNPMPDTYRVRINDLTKISSCTEQFRQIDGVYKVNAPHDFAEFLISMRFTLSIIGGAVMFALITVSLVIVYNSTRTSVFSRRTEINIMKYVGATNAFIRIPFFIEGMLIGVLAGIVSWGLTKLAYESIISLFNGDIMIWQALGLSNVIAFSDVSLYVLVLNCAAGAFLGAIGTIMSMGKHLKV